MNSDYMDLKLLQGMRGYQKLQALWAHEYVRIVDGMRKAAKKGQETNWRYFAGQMEGFDLAVTHLDRALIQMEKEGEADSPATQTVEELLKDIRPKGDSA